jgi:hypothetical protein
VTFKFRTLLLLTVGCLFASFAGAQGFAPSVRPSARIHAKVDRKVMSSLRGTHPAIIDNATIGGRLSAQTQLQHMVLVLKPSDEQSAALMNLLDAQQDKSSGSYHKWLTPDTFGTSFGVAPSDIAQVSAWLSDSGLAVESVSRSGRFITFSGTVGSVETAFNTQMHHVTVNGEVHISNTTDVAVPAALVPVVKGLARLNDFVPRSHMVKLQKVTVQRNPNAQSNVLVNQPDILAGGGAHFMGPGDMAAIYNATPLTAGGNTGKGIMIAVLARSNIAVGDVAAYRSLFGLPTNNPNVIVVGSDPGVNTDDVEASLDAEMAGSLATGATVDFIVSSASLVGGGIDEAGLYAVDNNIGDIITLSYGGCETNDGASGAGFWNDLWEQAAAQGQTAFVSTGDSGAAGCAASNSRSAATTTVGVNALGSSNFNVAVGGSMFVDFGTTQYFNDSIAAAGPPTYTSSIGYIPEAAWNEGRLTTTDLNATSTGTVAGTGISGTGGGVSIFNARPSWQTGSGIPLTDPTPVAPNSPIMGLHRLVPDVAFVANSGHDATVFCAEGVCGETPTGGLTSFDAVGGTSVATPAMASAQALIDAANGGRQGNANYYYYALANNQYTASTTACQAVNGTAASPTVTLPASNCNFHDIVAGSNIVPTATTGTTGFGFSAGTGYDETTGLGSVNIANVANNWHTVVFNSTTTSFSLTPTTLVHGSGQNVSVQVTAGTGTPTGDVSIIASSLTATGSPIVFTLSGGSASGSILSPLPAGSYSVHAHYAGDGVFAPSDSAPISVNISKEDSTFSSFQPFQVTSAGAVNAISSMPFGSGELYLDTELIPSSGAGTASGTVVFTVTRNGAPMPGLTTSLDTFGTTYLLAGPPFPSFFLLPNYANLAGGTYTVSAAYSGDTSFNPSSTTTTFTITPISPTVSFTTSTADITAGGTATLNFVVTAPASAQGATGTVSFTDTTTSTSLGTATVVNGKATLNTTAITGAGANNITAVYTGDASYKAITPAAVTVNVITTATTTTALTAGAASVGASTTLTATVTPAPTGTASAAFFYDAGVLLGSGTVSTTTGKATLAVTNFTAGVHNLTAVYAGNSTHLTSTGSLTLTVSKNVTALTISGNQNSTFGQNVIFLGAIGHANPTVAAPVIGLTGVVSFYDGSVSPANLLGSAAPVFGAGGVTADYLATFGTSTLNAGTHNILAFYAGDANYAAATSATVPLTVAKANQTITFTGLPATVAAGSPVSFTLTGTASSGLPVTYTVTGPATLSGNTLTINSAGPGTVTVTASQAGNANYNAAVPVTQTIVIGTVQLVTTAVLSNTGSGYRAVVTVVNNGSVTAQNVQLTAATLGAASATGLPASFGSIAGGSSATVTITFPASAGAPGATVAEKLTGTYTGGTFGGSFRASLPNSQQAQ